MGWKYCWQLVLDAVFTWIHRGDRSLCGGTGYEQQHWASAA
ncbi:hypothetical protein [Iningainema tapete]|nr:hypothetical protein [Iningainema tapete]